MARQSLSRYLPWLVTAPAAMVVWPLSGWASAGLGLLFVLGWIDFKQTKQAVRRNYPLTGRLRYALEYIRPELRQYFLEDDEEKLPFSRNQRAMVYARSKVQNDKRGFGSIKDMYATGSEWIAHSLQPVQPDPATFRVQVGAGQCTQPYSLSLLNVSGMSFGALSPNAIKALNRGAALGGFAHDTGEGSISVHHREHGGDLIWQIASGYFGCRTPDGHFDAEKFALQAQSPQVKMIEVKLSQGAKPGHGGRSPGRAHGPGLRLARPAFSLFNPYRVVGLCHPIASVVGGQAGRHQTVCGSSSGMVFYGQSHVGHRPNTRLCGGRRCRGRHGRCPDRICRPCGHAPARRFALGSQQLGGRRSARSHQDWRFGQGHFGF
jgi:hypothetical protein